MTSENSAWPRLAIGRIAEPRLGGNYRNTESVSGRPLIKMGNIARVNIDLSRLEYIPDTETVSPSHRLRYGDVLFNTRNTLDLVGKVSIWRDELPVAYYNSNILRLEFKPDYCGDSRYFGYALNAAESIEAIRNLATGTTSVAAVYTRDLLKLRVPVPSKSEQRAIADTLEDVDRLISSLKRLIAKKQAIKQGLVQRLFRSARVGEMSDNAMRSGNLVEFLRQPATYGIVKAGEFQRTGVPMVRGGDIRNGKISSDLPCVTRKKSDEYMRTVLQHGDVVVALVGYPGESAVVPDRLVGANISRAVGLLRPAQNLLPEFLAHYLNSSSGRQEFLKPSAGSAQIVVNLVDLNRMEVSIPSTDAQAAIAATLTDADTEISTLRVRLDKAMGVKIGMMQQLLTGRTRLPANEGVA
ncbi:restriction endonuclease subunit S [Streptomyces pseudogriseolus]|uniref:restriction endonuclease subunit S n=1 Tax=Streptomyces pseudogriseolus TaxID=36817 RepID=UPI003FA1EB40